VDDFNEALWREIERIPAGLSDTRRIQIAAATVTSDYTMSPGTRNYLIRLGLVSHLMELLEPSTEETED
jgi:hypothetical protein